MCRAKTVFIRRNWTKKRNSFCKSSQLILKYKKFVFTRYLLSFLWTCWIFLQSHIFTPQPCTYSNNRNKNKQSPMHVFYADSHLIINIKRLTPNHKSRLRNVLKMYKGHLKCRLIIQDIAHYYIWCSTTEIHVNPRLLSIVYYRKYKGHIHVFWNISFYLNCF